MSDGTTTLAIQSALDRPRLNPAARRELITRSLDRLAAVARRLLGPAYRERPEDTSGPLAAPVRAGSLTYLKNAASRTPVSSVT